MGDSSSAAAVGVSLLGLALALCCLQAAAGHDVRSKREVERIAFGSCAHQFVEQPIWKSIRSFKPDTWIWLGDNIYADTKTKKGLGPLGKTHWKEADEERTHELYTVQRNKAGYRELAKEARVLGTWDDHDYGLDGAGKEFIGKTWSQRLLLDFLGVPEDDPRRRRRGVYSSHLLGAAGRQVKVIMLDTRYHRDAVDTTGGGAGGGTGTILGEEQWAWLEAELRDNPAQVTLLGSSVQVVPDYGATLHPLTTTFQKWFPKLEGWANFPHERQRLADLVVATNTSGLIALSGDVHFGEINELGAGCYLGYPFLEATSSGLTHTIYNSIPAWAVWILKTVGPAPHQRGGYSGRNWGSLLINWDHHPPMLRLQVHSERGRAEVEKTVLLTDLQAGDQHHQRLNEHQRRAHCPDMTRLPLHLKYRIVTALGAGAGAVLMALLLGWRALRALGRFFRWLAGYTPPPELYPGRKLAGKRD